jgi:hypothetical protein
MVRILGDLTGLGRSFDQAKGKAGDTAKGVSSTIGQMLSTLNQGGILGPFGESLATANQAFGELAETGRHVGTVMLGLGGAFVGVGTGLAILGSKDQAARQQLQAAIDATGRSWDDYSARVEEAIKHNEKFGDTADKTQNALQILTQATGDPTKAFDLLSTATDLAAAKHEDLTTAATQLAKVYNGSTKLLKEFGIAVTSTKAVTAAAAADTRAAATADRAAATAKQRLADLETIDAAKKRLTVTEAVRLRDAQQKVTATTTAAAAAHQKATSAQTAAATATKAQGGALDQLSGKLKGQAAAAADTFTGRLKALTTEIEDQAAAWGNKYGPVLQVAGQAFAVVGGTIDVGRKILDKYRAAQDAAKKSREAMTAAEAASVPFEWASLGPILLIIAALAALGVAAYLIYRNWTTIWKAMKTAVRDVWDWIKANWPLLLAILTGPVGLAVLEIVRHWNGLVSFFAGLPARIARAAVGMWDGVYNEFKRVMDEIKNFKVQLPSPFGKIPLNLGSVFGGLTTGKIPGTNIKLFAEGGVVPYTGLIYAHAGETVIPAGQTPALAGRAGPVVAIANAHFSSDVDVEAFMRRVAWTVQTQRI